MKLRSVLLWFAGVTAASFVRYLLEGEMPPAFYFPLLLLGALGLQRVGGWVCELLSNERET